MYLSQYIYICCWLAERALEPHATQTELTKKSPQRSPPVAVSIGFIYLASLANTTSGM